MADIDKRYGTSLLALTTLRPPDPDRGASLVHLELTLPPTVATQLNLSHTGGRGVFGPTEAAALLWGLPVAQFLDGRTDAWLDTPGVKSLLPGLIELTETEPSEWPNSQTQLRARIAKAAPGSPPWPALFDELTKSRTVDLLNDLVLVFKYAALHHDRPVRTAAELYRLCRTLLQEGGPASRDQVIGWLTAPLVVPRVFTAPPGPSGPRPPQPTPPTGGLPTHTVPHLDVTSTFATRTLERLASELTAIDEHRRATELRNAAHEAGVRDPLFIERIASLAITDRGARSATIAEPFAGIEGTMSAAIYRPPAAVRSEVISVHLFGTPFLIDVAAAKARTGRVRRLLAQRLLEALPEVLRNRVTRAGVALEDLTIWPDLLTVAAHSPSYLEPMGRTDLLLVRQTTIGYRRAEIAYIENVLVGEKRNRDHTHRVLSRQEFFESVTSESEETRDLQVTDKADLNREVSKVVSEDLKAEGSVQVTSRGPTKVVASASVSFGRSTEEAAKAAESYSRETIERAVKRTLERVVREQRTLFEQETTEVNHHGFEREPDAEDHVTGVYQYLERISRAKLFWYGEREMYDLLVPEPAALIWQLAITSPELQIAIEAPDTELFASLTVDNIATMREQVIRAFRVTDIPPIPEETREIPMSFSATGGGDGAQHAIAKELQIPDGYVVGAASFAVSAEVEDSDDEPNGGVTVGGHVQLWDMTLSGNKGSATLEFAFAPPLSGPAVSVGFNADNFTSIAGSVTLKLTLTAAARQAWALGAYGRVAERYEQLRREYAQAVIQSTANRAPDTVSLPQGSRLALQQIVRNELQRSVIDLMRNAPVDFKMIQDYPYANADGTLRAHPSIDYDALHASAPEVRFLQQAFEWEHLAWIVYPYFWGRRSEWTRTVVVSHPDPDFAAFLNAGAARVQIPVRPGFEELVKHYMETREVYGGEGLPKIGDPGYVSFIDEQLTTLGAPGDEVPWPPAAPREWNVVAPTSLVLVRSLKRSQLPAWDPQNGDEIVE